MLAFDFFQAPGDAGFKVEDTLTKDKKRFEAVNDAVQNKADKYRASKLKNAEVPQILIFLF